MRENQRLVALLSYPLSSRGVTHRGFCRWASNDQPDPLDLFWPDDTGYSSVVGLLLVRHRFILRSVYV